MISLDKIASLLAQSFNEIELIERYDRAIKRYSDTGVIIFSFLLNSKKCVIKYYTLENISREKIKERIQIINKEYELAKRVTAHPQFVKVFRHDKIKMGQKYIGIVMQMEFFEDTLDRFIEREKKFTNEEVWHFLEEMSDALEYMHHIISDPFAHLDIKPSNIGIRKLTNGQVQYVLMDFDVSADLESNNKKTIDLTKSSSSGFTPGYASPEQIKRFGKGHGEICFKSDIYSIGIIAAEMLTGIKPGRSANLTEKSLAQLPKKLQNAIFTLCLFQAEQRPDIIKKVLVSKDPIIPKTNKILIGSAALLFIVIIVTLVIYLT